MCHSERPKGAKNLAFAAAEILQSLRFLQNDTNGEVSIQLKMDAPRRRIAPKLKRTPTPGAVAPLARGHDLPRGPARERARVHRGGQPLRAVSAGAIVGGGASRGGTERLTGTPRAGVPPGRSSLTHQPDPRRRSPANRQPSA